MHRYSWPGNVRELENVIKSAVILAEDRILPHHLPPQFMNASVQPQTASRTEALKATSKQAAKEAERDLIIKTLLSCHWNKAKAARRLGIDYKTLYNKIKAYGIIREEAVK